MTKIAVIAGSLRREAYSKKIAHALIALAPAGVEMEFVDLKDLTLFNDDLDVDGQTPAGWTEFRNKIKAADGVIFCTPEYNRTITGVLKNAIDIGSRPAGQNAWSGKAAGVISSSMGRMAGVSAHGNLRQALASVNLTAMAQPEVFVGSVQQSFDEEGRLIDERLEKNLKAFAEAFVAFTQKHD